MTPGRKGGRAAAIGTAQVLAGSVLISFSAVFVRLAPVGPTVSGFYRMLFGTAFLAGVVAWRRERVWCGARPLAWAVVAGVLFAADLFCWHRSIHAIGPGLATIMGNFQVFVLAAVGVAVFGERLTWRLVVSIPIALLGLFLLVGTGRTLPPETTRRGVVYGLLTAGTYAAFLLTLRRAQREPVRLSPTANIAVVSAVTAAALWATARAEGAGLAVPDRRTWPVLAAYGVLCQALGWIVITTGLPRIPASRAGVLLLLQPTLTFVWDMLFFARPTTALEASGAAMAVVAIYLGGTAGRPADARDDTPPPASPAAGGGARWFRNGTRTTWRTNRSRQTPTSK